MFSFLFGKKDDSVNQSDMPEQEMTAEEAAPEMSAEEPVDEPTTMPEPEAPAQPEAQVEEVAEETVSAAMDEELPAAELATDDEVVIHEPVAVAPAPETSTEESVVETTSEGEEPQMM